MRSLVVAALAFVAFDAVAAGSGAIPCYCRHAGRQFEMGAVVCLPTADGPRFARCGMDQNVPSWMFTTTPCALSRSPPPRGPAPGRG